MPVNNDDLVAALGDLDPGNDDHWNKEGEPDLNHLKEAVGGRVTRKMIADLGWGDHNREAVAEAVAVAEVAGPSPDGPAPTVPDNAADAQTGEPALSEEQRASADQEPHTSPTIDAAARIIELLDQASLAMTAEVRTRQDELAQVIKMYQANRPTIMERQARLEARRRAGARV